MYDASIAMWNGVDALAEERFWLTPYNYVQNNPLVRIDPDGNQDDIVIKGENNSSITIKTDLIDVEVDAGGIVGDFEGNFVLEGDDILIASLDIVGIVDPTPVSDGLAATLEAKNGNYGMAILSGFGVIPLIGDLGKLGKLPKHLKTINKAIDGVKAGKKVPLPKMKSSPFGPKIADKVPTNGVPQNWNKDQIGDAITDYQTSLSSRKKELTHFMENNKGDAIGHKLHTQRITEEEAFLSSLQKAFKNR